MDNNKLMVECSNSDSSPSPPEAPQSVTLEIQDVVVSLDTFFGLQKQEHIKEE